MVIRSDECEAAKRSAADLMFPAVEVAQMLAKALRNASAQVTFALCLVL